MLSGSYDPDQSGLGAFQEFPQVSNLHITDICSILLLVSLQYLTCEHNGKDYIFIVFERIRTVRMYVCTCSNYLIYDLSY